MTRFLPPILLLTILFPALAFGETMDDLVERDGLYYKKFTDVPFTGEVTGEIKSSFRNGKRDGPWVTYFDSGQLKVKGTYKDGKRDGLWVSYHDNGQLFQKGSYKDDNADGPWLGYMKDGKVDDNLTGTFKNGEKIK
jgi:hypothetical protein